MTRDERNLFTLNLMKFGIGAVLLLISWNYLQAHPAEKISLMSGVQVISQRVQFWALGLVGGDADLLRQKIRLEQYFEELIRYAEDQVCVGPETLQQMHEDFLLLKALRTSELDTKLQFFSVAALDYETQIQQECFFAGE